MLTDEQLAWVTHASKRDGVSRAEVMRHAIDEARERERQEFRDAMDAAFGIWKDANIDALEYERQLRQEWERDHENPMAGSEVSHFRHAERQPAGHPCLGG